MVLDITVKKYVDIYSLNGITLKVYNKKYVITLEIMSYIRDVIVKITRIFF